MIAPETPDNEEERLDALESFSILDTLPEADYDDITALAAEICGTPISTISLVDKDRQWFKSKQGVDVSETSRDISFCGHAINDPENTMVVGDATKDDRFHDNPFVTGDLNIRFYAGVPFLNEEGLPLGTLCVFDNKPNELTESQLKALNVLSKQVMNLLKLRKSEQLLKQDITNLGEKNLELEQFAFVAAHDLKSPLNNITSLSNLFKTIYGPQVDAEGNELIDLIIASSSKLKKLIDGLLDYSRSEEILKENKSNICTLELKGNITSFFSHEKDVNISIDTSEVGCLEANETAINQVLINLITNAIKYNDKENATIDIKLTDSTTHYIFSILDNGPGIPDNKKEEIFKIFAVNATEDKYGNRGNGIGLATVKKIVEKLGGTINVESELGNGSNFIFSIKK
ncbi:GAF domain-containing sensor histidine kinase [Cellulophaga baltica]|uniref:GAF domain-containing sensor histidine kinase n=1 Tax=Cellulophaga TaxID=104264 RepID=UPI001C0702EC|nr:MULTISPECIES: GAF domain-containing sensor histidine kinase [Cellulophaga]MBU2997904.1 GAF domain-containing sensor histidine kinase [Cellulophaga baltica]MDO6769305.1 GAF domain-containing sensor histidine kinase [Cellulophaga sp. 1_MG-2023]